MFQSSILAAVLLAAPGLEEEPKSLGIGDPAPPIQVASWVKGEPISALEKDKTYVVEFWATWCGPCRKSIPHITKLADKYTDVHFVGVSVWERDWEGVEPFVAKMGDEMDYHVAKDLVDEKGDGFMAERWMAAAGQNGIPAAFIVKDGRVAWIGHPMTMDGPLGEVVAGKWDIDAKAKEYRAQRELELKLQGLRDQFEAARDEGRYDEALTLLTQLEQADAANAPSYGFVRFDLLLQKGDFEKAYAKASELVAGPAKDEPGMLNAIAWTIVDPERELAKRDLDLALKAAQRANELTNDANANVLDTLARVHFVRGDAKQALEIQRRAVENAADSPMEKELRDRLAQYEQAVQGAGTGS